MKLILFKTKTPFLDAFSILLFSIAFPVFLVDPLAHFVFGDSGEIITEANKFESYLGIGSILFITALSGVLTILTMRWLFSRAFGVKTGDDRIEVDLSRKNRDKKGGG
jgi:hypothetical protein